MKKWLRRVAAVLTAGTLLSSVPTFTASAAVPSDPFDYTVVNGSTCSLTGYKSNYSTEKSSTKVISSVNVSSATTFGSNDEVTLYDTTIKSTGNRKMKARSLMGKTTNLWAESFNVHIAIGNEGARLFTYSMPCSSGFQNGYVEDIAKAFEAEHPEWSVAVVTNGSFFHNVASYTKNTESEPEDIYIEAGKTYDAYMEKGKVNASEHPFKVGRGVIGIDKDGNILHCTIENGTTNYSSASTAYTWNTNYTLEVLGDNLNNAIYTYPLTLNGAVDYSNTPKFLPTGVSGYTAGGYIYKIKCSEYKKAYKGVNGMDVSTDPDKMAPTYFFEGKVESVSQHLLTSASSSVNSTPASGYVYVVSNTPLEHIEVGTVLRGQRKMSGTWKNVQYAFGFKQQILLDGRPLFDNAFQEAYGDTKYGSWNAWTEDVQYATYGSNRTAIGFKENGEPVIISIPRTQYFDEYSERVEIGASYHEVAWYMKSLGCVNAFMMDCGGSVHMSAKNFETGEYYDVVNNPGLTAGTVLSERLVYNALIIAYPSGKAANPTDSKLPDPAFNNTRVTPAADATWYTGRVPLRSLATISAKGETTTNTTITHTNFTFNQSGTTFTLTPNSTAGTSGHSMYAYKKLPYTIGEGKHYTYFFKLKTYTKGLYCSFLFAELTGNTASKKMLNNFATVGGAFSNNGDSGYSDVRLGYGRVEAGVSGDVEYKNQNINLYLRSSYSMFRLDIDGCTVTLKARHQEGKWLQIGSKELTKLNGAQVVFGLASWFNSSGSASGRSISVTAATFLDRTALENNLATANALNSVDYTPDTWGPVETAVAKVDYAKNRTSQTYVNYVNNLLANGISGLVKRIDLAKANIAEYEAADRDLYTDESWETYTDAYNKLVESVASVEAGGSPSILDSPNAVYADAKSKLVLVIISVEIDWQEMNFTYKVSGVTWDPETHTYMGDGQSEWVPDGNSNIIGITNNSDVDVSFEFDFSAESEFEDLSGSFYDGETLLSDSKLRVGVGVSDEVALKLNGSIPSDTVAGTKGGTVTVTVSRRS